MPDRREQGMIRYLTDGEKEESRDLWEEAFPEDSRSFDDYYFGEKLGDNRILVLEEEHAAGSGEDGNGKPGSSRIVSMIHLNPYVVQAAGLRWQVDYLVGVATRKDRRHRGYMRRLLLRMMEDMRVEGMPFCFLMPADEAIYRPFGFTYIFRQPVVGLRDGGKLREQEILAPGSKDGGQWTPDGMARWMNQWLESRYEVFAVRDGAYVRRLLLELASEDGSFRLLYERDGGNAGEVRSVRNCESTGKIQSVRDVPGTVVGMVSEWGLEKREQRLLYCEDSYVEEKAPARPAIMARIISPGEFVRAIRLEEAYDREQVTIRLRLTDPLIAGNDGWWLWHLGRENSWMERWDRAGEEPELFLTIEELTCWLFGYDVPEAVKAAGLDGVVRTLRGVFLDEVV